MSSGMLAEQTMRATTKTAIVAWGDNAFVVAVVLALVQAADGVCCGDEVAAAVVVAAAVAYTGCNGSACC